MKVVRVEDGIVREIIPEYALPVEQWYGAAFAQLCVEAPDEVQEYWSYNQQTGEFSEPQETGPELTEIDEVRLAIAELALAMDEQNTANQLAIAEAVEAMMGGEESW